jgi:cytochrome c551/c552
MCSSRSLALLLALLGTAAGAAERYPGIGRSATASEVAAWDIDVRPDFKGLPAGRGTVAQGQALWEAKCASCHGVFGESNEVFTPLIGGTAAADIARGRVARLTDAGFPLRSTVMKLPTLSTLWDYIHRAMPWNAPRSLSGDEVYAVTAYMLHLAEVLPADGELSDRNIRDVQQRLPNRDGMTRAHALWPGAAQRPDVQGSRCMTNCRGEPQIASRLPEHARGSHGDIAQQQRAWASQTPPAPSTGVGTLLEKNACIACHAVDRALVGPSLRDVAAKYAQRGDAAAYLASKIKAGGAGVWGSVPMPAQTLSDGDASAIAAWLAAGAKP